VFTFWTVGLMSSFGMYLPVASILFNYS